MCVRACCHPAKCTGYSTFFVNKTNADVVGAAFTLMEKAMVRCVSFFFDLLSAVR